MCCHSLDHYELPVFKPSTSEIRAAATAALVITESGTQTLLAAELHSPKQTRTESGRYDSVHGMSNLSYALSLGELMQSYIGFLWYRADSFILIIV